MLQRLAKTGIGHRYRHLYPVYTRKRDVAHIQRLLALLFAQCGQDEADKLTEVARAVLGELEKHATAMAHTQPK